MHCFRLRRAQRTERRETCPLQSWFSCNNFGLSAVVFLWPRERQLCVYSCYWWTNWNIKDYKSVISDTKPFLCEIVSDCQCECVVYLLLFPIGALRLHSLDFFSDIHIISAVGWPSRPLWVIRLRWSEITISSRVKHIFVIIIKFIFYIRIHTFPSALPSTQKKQLSQISQMWKHIFFLLHSSWFVGFF